MTPTLCPDGPGDAKAEALSLLPKGIIANTAEIYAEVASYDVVPLERLKDYWRVYTITHRRLYDPTAGRLESFWWHVWGSNCRHFSGKKLASLFESISKGPTVVPLRAPTSHYRGPCLPLPLLAPAERKNSSQRSSDQRSNEPPANDHSETRPALSGPRSSLPLADTGAADTRPLDARADAREKSTDAATATNATNATATAHSGDSDDAMTSSTVSMASARSSSSRRDQPTAAAKLRPKKKFVAGASSAKRKALLVTKRSSGAHSSTGTEATPAREVAMAQLASRPSGQTLVEDDEDGRGTPWGTGAAVSASASSALSSSKMLRQQQEQQALAQQRRQLLRAKQESTKRRGASASEEKREPRGEAKEKREPAGEAKEKREPAGEAKKELAKETKREPAGEAKKEASGKQPVVPSTETVGRLEASVGAAVTRPLSALPLPTAAAVSAARGTDSAASSASSTTILDMPMVTRKKGPLSKTTTAADTETTVVEARAGAEAGTAGKRPAVRPVGGLRRQSTMPVGQPTAAATATAANYYPPSASARYSRAGHAAGTTAPLPPRLIRSLSQDSYSRSRAGGSRSGGGSGGGGNPAVPLSPSTAAMSSATIAAPSTFRAGAVFSGVEGPDPLEMYARTGLGETAAGGGRERREEDLEEDSAVSPTVGSPPPRSQPMSISLSGSGALAYNDPNPLHRPLFTPTRPTQTPRIPFARTRSQLNIILDREKERSSKGSSSSISFGSWRGK